MSQTSPSLGAPPIEILVPLSLLRPPLNEPVCSCHPPQLTPAHLYINLLLPFLEGGGAQCNAGGYLGMLGDLPTLCAIYLNLIRLNPEYTLSRSLSRFLLFLDFFFLKNSSILSFSILSYAKVRILFIFICPLCFMCFLGYCGICRLSSLIR